MSLRRVHLADRFAFDLSTESTRKLTPEGYLVARGSMSRAGNVQAYTATELGIEATDRIIKLYRPPEEVFSAEALASFENKPITCFHPPSDVTAENWRDYAVGDVHDIKAADQSMDGSLIVRDRYVVDEVVRGYRGQLSCGYSFDLDMTPGTAPGGEAYDGVQRNIRGNHLAIVDLARGGPGCRIHDGHRRPNDEGARPMATKKITVDRLPLDLEERDALTVERAVGDRDDRIKSLDDQIKLVTKRAVDAETALEALKAEHAKHVSDSAAKIKSLEDAQIKPAQLDALVAERTKVCSDGLALMPELKTDGKNVAQIRTEVLTRIVADDNDSLGGIAKAVLGGVEPSKADVGKVCSAFDAVVAHAATLASDDPEETPAKARDAEIGRALAGGTRPKVKPLIGRELYMHRKQHGFDADKAAE